MDGSDMVSHCCNILDGKTCLVVDMGLWLFDGVRNTL